MSRWAIGKFDALHVGHRALASEADVLLRLTGLAQAFGWPARPVLVAEADRARVLADWRTRESAHDVADLRALDADGFVAWLRAQGCTALVVGPDFRCGRGRSAGAPELRAAGLPVTVVEPVLVGGAPASSSRIRHALERGDVTEATACLGRPHRLLGVVQRGDGRGRGLGFPTANLACHNLIPATGVYAATAWVDGVAVAAAVNIGHLPTIAAERPLTVEAHLIGWQGDLYGRTLGLDLQRRIRGEQRFASLDELRKQIAADVAAAAG